MPADGVSRPWRPRVSRIQRVSMIGLRANKRHWMTATFELWIAIGPEAGWTSTNRTMPSGMGGQFSRWGTRLRTSTAAVAAATLLSHRRFRLPRDNERNADHPTPRCVGKTSWPHRPSNAATMRSSRF